MIELTDLFPDTNVQAAEYQRLLGYPRDHALDDRALELSEMARAWYGRHGRPWMYARQVDRVALANGGLRIGGVVFASRHLRETFAAAGANSAILVAVSAGPEIEAEAQARWREEKPDEYFFFEVYGSAVVEHLVMMAGARLCAAAERDGLAVLSPYSPGYPEWDIAQQRALMDLIFDPHPSRMKLPGPLEVMSSGMLRPKKSLLAVFGMTPHTERVRKLTELVPCQRCALPGCQYRRSVYSRPRTRAMVEA
jgi:hypothetical protein